MQVACLDLNLDLAVEGSFGVLEESRWRDREEVPDYCRSNLKLRANIDISIV